mgnify:CR=1 FL=1
MFQMFSFRKWCFKFSIFHHKAEFKYPSIYDCHLNTWKSPKMQRSNFGNLGLREKIFDFCLCWEKTETIFRLKWVYQYIGILNSESSKYFLAIVIWKLEKNQKTQKWRVFFEMLGFSRWRSWTLTCI